MALDFARMTRRLATQMARLALLAVVLTSAGCGGGQTFSASDGAFSFAIPDNWTLTRDEAGSGGAQQRVTVALRPPFDQIDIATYKLSKKLPGGVNGYKPEVARIVGRLTSRTGAKASRPRTVKYGGRPGFRYLLTYSAAGQKLQNELVLLFSGRRLLQIACQSAPENRDAIKDGCEEILDSLKLN